MTAKSSMINGQISAYSVLIFNCLRFDNKVLIQLKTEDGDDESECLRL